MTILICFVQILVHFSFQSPGMCAFLLLEHKQYENKMCIHLELFCENILSLSDMPGYRDLASFLFSRLQLYLVSQPCYGWSSPSMALSGFTKIPNLLPAFLSSYLYSLNCSLARISSLASLSLESLKKSLKNQREGVRENLLGFESG